MRAAVVRFAGLSCRLVLLTLLFLSLCALTTCTARLPSAPAAAPMVLPLPDVAADVWKSRGNVVHQEPYDPPLEDRDAVLGQAWRAVYSSVSGVDGGIREVSGAFFVPRGNPPEKGWPVISFAHGTTGIGQQLRALPTARSHRVCTDNSLVAGGQIRRCSHRLRRTR